MSSAPASFREPTPLAQLVGTADLIVAGTVVEARADRFVLRVQDRIRGEHGAPEVTVALPRRLPTEPRWAPYQEGQTIVAFLIRAEADSLPDAPWRIAGIGGDGELPFDESHVYLFGHFVEGLPLEKYALHGGVVPCQRIERATFLAALEAYFDCFAWSTGKGGPRQVCPDAELAAFRARSPLHRVLVRETRALIAARRGG